jgi:hypothetical protein
LLVPLGRFVGVASVAPAVATLAERVERDIRPDAAASTFAFVADLLARGFLVFFVVVSVSNMGTS